MVSVVIKSRGVKSAKTKLNKVIVNIQRNAFSSALAFAMLPIRREMKRRTPIGLGEDESGNPRPHLKDVIKSKGKRYKKAVYRVVGYSLKRSDGAFHSTILEVGASHHETPLNDPTKASYGIDIKNTAGKNDPGLALPGIFFKLRELFDQGKDLQHPGIDAASTAKDSFNAKKAAVKTRFNKRVSQQIDKESKKLAAKQAKKGFI